MKLKQTKRLRKTVRYRRGGGRLDEIEQQIRAADSLAKLHASKTALEHFDILENDEILAPLVIERQKLRIDIDSMLDEVVIKNYIKAVKRVTELNEQIDPRSTQLFARKKGLGKTLDEKIYAAMSKR